MQKFLLATLENTHTDRKKASSEEVRLWQDQKAHAGILLTHFE